MSLSKLTANFINNSKACQKLFSKIGSNSSSVQVGVASTSNFILRPLAVMVTGKNILDSAYSASSSIASGIGENLTRITLLKPFNKSLNKSVDKLQSNGFFNSISKELNDTPENIINKTKDFLSRSFLIGLVGINSGIKFFIHPPLAHKVKDVTENIRKKQGLNKWA